jgi:hypothetical protein
MAPYRGLSLFFGICLSNLDIADKFQISPYCSTNKKRRGQIEATIPCILKKTKTNLHHPLYIFFLIIAVGRHLYIPYDSVFPELDKGSL